MIERCFKYLDQSCQQDKFHQLLFQYTDDCAQVRKMFIDTDDYLKYSFFAQDQYLFNVTI